MSGIHRKPNLQALTRATSKVALHAVQLREKITRRTLTRATGGAAVGAALVATIAATASVADGGVPRSGPNLAAAAASGTTDYLAAEPKSAQTSKPLVKVKKAPAVPAQRPVTANDVIELAEEQVGISETDGEGGGTKFQDWYATTDRAKQTVERDGGNTSAYKDAAWCVMFLSWIGNQLDFNEEIGADAWTIAHAQWFKDKGRWGDTPKPGAVVYFDWNGGSSDIDAIDHVGLVTKVNDDGTFDTVEGNISDAVVKKTRTFDAVVGFGYPDYAE